MQQPNLHEDLSYTPIPNGKTNNPTSPFSLPLNPSPLSLSHCNSLSPLVIRNSPVDRYTLGIAHKYSATRSINKIK